MDAEPVLVESVQPELFPFGEISEGTLELFPAVWGACEDLIAPEVTVRQKGLDKLLELKAPRLSHLVAYLLATRVTEPDLGLRARVVDALSDLLIVGSDGRPASEAVRRTLHTYLSQIRQPAILALLDASACEPGMEAKVAALLNACPEGGHLLVEILTERKFNLEMRCQAARLISRVGYLDTLPELERLVSRLESRIAGQQTMPFAPPAAPSEQVLLDEVLKVVSLLRQP